MELKDELNKLDRTIHRLTAEAEAEEKQLVGVAQQLTDLGFDLNLPLQPQLDEKISSHNERVATLANKVADLCTELGAA